MASAIGLAAFVSLDAIGARAPQAPAERTFPVPMSLVQEHATFITDLNTAANVSGDTGTAARRVLTMVIPHFKDEQREIHPLLYALPMLAAHRTEPWMADLVPLAEQLPRHIDEVRAAHVTIDAALDALYAAAWRDNHRQYAFLALRIRRHNQMEEEIAYPAALLVGAELQLRFPTPTANFSPETRGNLRGSDARAVPIACRFDLRSPGMSLAPSIGRRTS